MGDKTVALKRDDFNTFSDDTLRGLLEDSDFFDVTLACSDGKQVMAHKVVLSAGSDFFHKLLKQNKHTHPLVVLHDLPQHLVLVSFVYVGACEVEQNVIEAFLRTAAILGVKGLTGQAGNRNILTEIIEEPDGEFFSTNNYQSVEKNETPIGKSGKKETKVSTPIRMKEEKVERVDKVEKAISQKENLEDKLPTEKIPNEKALETKSLNCDLCTYHTTRLTQLNRHIKSVHEGLKYTCELCNYKITDETLLKNI